MWTRRAWSGPPSFAEMAWAAALLTSSPGFLTGVCGVAVGYPLDTVKVQPLPGLCHPPQDPCLGLGPHLWPEELSSLLGRPCLFPHNLPWVLRTVSAPFSLLRLRPLTSKVVTVTALPTARL